MNTWLDLIWRHLILPPNLKYFRVFRFVSFICLEFSFSNSANGMAITGLIFYSLVKCYLPCLLAKFCSIPKPFQKIHRSVYLYQFLQIILEILSLYKICKSYFIISVGATRCCCITDFACSAYESRTNTSRSFIRNCYGHIKEGRSKCKYERKYSKIAR